VETACQAVSRLLMKATSTPLVPEPGVPLTLPHLPMTVTVKEPQNGPPGALLVVEFVSDSRREAIEAANDFLDQFEEELRTPNPTWDTTSLQEEFEVLGFRAPYVVVRRRSDDKVGSLQFVHHPRIYFGWSEYEEE